MKKLYKFNINGHECFLTQATYHKIADEIHKHNEEIQRINAEKEWELNGWKAVKRARETWENTHNPEDWDFYSDIYKDYYGVRP